MRKIFLLLLGAAALIFNTSLSFAQYIPRIIEPATPLTLKAALAMALRANSDLAASGHELEAVEASILQAGTRPNPAVSALIEDTRRATRTTTLQLHQPIELGGKREARLEAARRGRDVASTELKASYSEIRATVITNFFDVLAAQERLQLAQSLFELAKGSTYSATQGYILN
jgi:cobalt-zinc-cadmium efflux system outer membrane protein